LSSGSSSDEAPFPSPLPDHKFKSEVFKSILAAGSSGGDSAAQEFNGEKPSAALTARNLDSNLNLTVLASLVKQIVEDELRPEEPYPKRANKDPRLVRLKVPMWTLKDAQRFPQKWATR
jgi:hypothetical protein